MSSKSSAARSRKTAARPVARKAASRKTSAKKAVQRGLPATARLLDIMTYLRGHADGCAWTQEQTHKSLTPYLIEEAYETCDIIDQGRHGETLRDELGDLLLQISFHAAIASERGEFDFEDVAKAIADKLERRYPTILGDEPNTLKTAAEIDRRWEEIKADERRKKGLKPDASILDEISYALPALMRANKLKGRASKAGWEWPDVSMLLDKISEEVGELKEELAAKKPDAEKAAAEFGDLLFMLVDFARWHGIDAEDALRKTNNRFERRFRFMEGALKKQGKTIPGTSRGERLALWDQAKKLEKKRKS
jgi:MazG family protein